MEVSGRFIYSSCYSRGSMSQGQWGETGFMFACKQMLLFFSFWLLLQHYSSFSRLACIQWRLRGSLLCTVIDCLHRRQRVREREADVVDDWEDVIASISFHVTAIAWKQSTAAKRFLAAAATVVVSCDERSCNIIFDERWTSRIDDQAKGKWWLPVMKEKKQIVMSFLCC